MSRVPPLGGDLNTEAPSTDEELEDQAIARLIEARQVIRKRGLSAKFGKPDKRRAQLVARLKRRRKYGDPVKGGTGRTKRKDGGGHFK